MGPTSSIYLLIFLPLISSLFCQIFSKKSFAFLIALASCFSLLFLEVKIFFDVLVHEKISSDFELSPLSLALEFRFDILSAIFLLIFTFLKSVILLFYRCNIEENISQREGNVFYSVFLLHLFSMVGVFTTNNLLNLFFFFEIYAFSFFATLSIAKTADFAKLSFRYFCLNSISSVLILFCILAVYLAFNSLSFDSIASDLPTISRYDFHFLVAIFAIMAFAIIIKFFPFWLYFEKLKSADLLANFLAIESLFIKSGIGIFVILKFVYFFFGNNLIFGDFHAAPIFIFLAISLIFYSAIKLYSQKHLKMISAYLCLNNIGFIISCIALQTVESLQALFFYLLNFSLTGLLIFIFATFLKRHFATSSLFKIWLVEKNNFYLALPLKLLIFSIAAFPLTNLFFANWYLTYASLNIGLEAFLLSGIIISNFVYISKAVDISETFFSKDGQHQNIASASAQIKNYSLYFTSFWLLISLVFFTIIASNVTNGISLKFASYLLSNTI